MNVLDAPMIQIFDNVEAATIRDYLKALLLGVWKEGEGFDGKRPFGDSGWDSDVYVSLVKAGLVDGHVDEDGYLDTCDTKKADALITEAILSL